MSLRTPLPRPRAGPMPKPYEPPSGEPLLRGVVDEDSLRMLQERNAVRIEQAKAALGAAYCCASIHSPTRN